MRDILPEDSARLTLIEDTFRDVLRSYSYEEIRLPVVEAKALFDRGLGEATDAVSKEMYSFEDRDGTHLALRPEGTASCARAIVNHSMAHEDKPRLWYAGPMFRHERPQSGRYRQFQQIGAEAFGYSGPAIDYELMSLGTEVFSKLGVLDDTTLLLNNIGNAAERASYRDALVDFLSPHESELDFDSRHRLVVNPIRILDSKNARTQEILEDAPKIQQFVSSESDERFSTVRRLLDSADIQHRIAPHLVRGFDYYTGTVFEWVTDKVGAQDAICAGGRYDGLIELLGGRPTPGIGFAAGIDRIALLLEKCEEDSVYQGTDVYVIGLGEEQQHYVAEVARRLRRHTDLRVREHTESGRMGAKMRWADKSGAKWALIAGDMEAAKHEVTIKWMRSDKEQATVSVDHVIVMLSEN